MRSLARQEVNSGFFPAPAVKKRKLSDQDTLFDRKSREGDQKHVVEVGFDKS